MHHFYILAITQIITESFPISSSGHGLLISHLLHVSMISSQAITYFFNTPTMIIIPLFFAKTWWPIIKGWRRTWPFIMRIALYALIASSITALLFVLFGWATISIPVWCMFGATGCALLSLMWCPVLRNQTLSVRYAIIIGLVQGCAFFPGLSRFACVYVATRWLGFAPRRAFEITWLVQWPLLVGASGVSVLMIWMKPEVASIITAPLALIMLMASGISFVCLCWVYRLVRVGRLWWFGVYMMIPMVVAYFYL